MIKVIRPDSYEKEILKSDIPVLMAFFRSDELFADQFRLLHELSEKYEGNLKICFGDTFFIDTYFQLLKFGGTPLYAIFRGGKEISRYFGRAGLDDLERFIVGSMPQGEITGNLEQ